MFVRWNSSERQEYNAHLHGAAAADHKSLTISKTYVLTNPHACEQKNNVEMSDGLNCGNEVADAAGCEIRLTWFTIPILIVIMRVLYDDEEHTYKDKKYI